MYGELKLEQYTFSPVKILPPIRYHGEGVIFILIREAEGLTTMRKHMEVGGTLMESEFVS